MPRQPSSVRPGALVQRVARRYSPAEWALLTGLPRAVLVCATWAPPGGRPSSVAAGLAGLDAIAAGRSYDCDLVRAVAATIYAETRSGEADPPTAPVAVLNACRRAAAVLAARADPADSAAYRHWLQHIAARASGVAGGAGVAADPTRRAFVTGLGAALGMR